MTSPMPPGWYPAMGDPPGTHRYWDGHAWQGDPHPMQEPLGFDTPRAPYPETSNAVAALICSIGGLFFCGVLFPIGWWLATKEIEGIDRGLRDPGNRGTAQAARVIGIIGTVFMILIIVLVAVFLLAAVSAA